MQFRHSYSIFNAIPALSREQPRDRPSAMPTKRWDRPREIIYKATWGRVCVPFTPSARHGALLLLPFGPAHADDVGHLESPELFGRLSLFGDACCCHGRASDDGLVLTWHHRRRVSRRPNLDCTRSVAKAGVRGAYRASPAGPGREEDRARSLSGCRDGDEFSSGREHPADHRALRLRRQGDRAPGQLTSRTGW